MLVRCVIDLRGTLGCCCLECSDEVSACRRPMHRVAGQQLVDDGDQAGRQRRAEAIEVGRVTLQPGQRGVGVGFTEERHTTSKAFIEHEAERVEVGTTVELLAPDLLG